MSRFTYEELTKRYEKCTRLVQEMKTEIKSLTNRINKLEKENNENILLLSEALKRTN
jgi:prefoldin subunit 5